MTLEEEIRKRIQETKEAASDAGDFLIEKMNDESIPLFDRFSLYVKSCGSLFDPNGNITENSEIKDFILKNIRADYYIHHFSNIFEEYVVWNDNTPENSIKWIKNNFNRLDESLIRKVITSRKSGIMWDWDW